MAKKICLIDGSGYIFRAFYGLPPLTSPDGTPVNAVEAMNLSFLEQEGFEADDLIATYANMAQQEGIEVVIVSADKDLMQLIKEGVSLYDPMKDKFFSPEDVKEKFGVYPDKVVDVQALAGDSSDNIPGVAGIGPKTAAELVNQFGSIAQVLSRAEEIKQNKRRETILANIENAKISLELVTLKSDVPVQNPPSFYECKCPDKNMIIDFADKYGFNSLKPRIIKWVEECGGANSAQLSQPEVAPSYHLITTEKELKSWYEQIKEAGVFSIKTFSTGASPIFDKVLGISLGIEGKKSAYIPLSKEDYSKEVVDLFSAPASSEQSLSDKTVFKYIKPLLEANSILKIGHNIKQDMHFISKALGVDINVFPYDDVEVMSYVLDSSSHEHSLPALSEIFLAKKLPEPADFYGTGKNKQSPAQIEDERVKEYVCSQADAIFSLHKIFHQRLISEQMVSVYELYDRPLIATLFEMEKNGIKVNAQKLSEFEGYLQQKMTSLEQEIYQIAEEDFNIASPKQVAEILYNKLGLKGKKNAKGALQTGAEVLEQMVEQHILPQKILDWRAFAKLKSTYTNAILDLLDKNSRVHTTYNQSIVNTGRLSSNNPNLQNIPIRSDEGLKIRQCFVAKPNHKLIAADYSQVELRLLAVLGEVRGLKEAFSQGIDVHTATAMQVFGLSKEEITPNIRRNAKAINFGIIYGQSQYGLAKQINVSPEEAKKYIDAYFAKLPEIKTYMEKTIQFAQKYGYVVTPFGRKCSVLGINDSNKRVASFAQRAAINAPLQGGSADIMKKAMNKVFAELKKGGYQTKVLLQVHDELVLEAPIEEVEIVSSIIKNSMENVIDYDVKFEVELGVGDNWAQAH